MSRNYQVTVDDIIAANPELNTSDIKSGQTIKIPRDKKPVSPANVLIATEIKTDDSEVTYNYEPCSPNPDKKEYKVAFLFPLYLDENKTIIDLDSISGTKNLEEKTDFPTIEKPAGVLRRSSDCTRFSQEGR
ncbi:MAG: LysM peptidoglycan-binding domain-containing protein [Bacteroidetes bacterium]|nr:LysM peptidoglycan-binding domain-containing protein [Bacteroidota bacterium]